MKFADLLKTPVCGSIGEQQTQSGRRFWAELERAGIRRWQPGQAVPASGTWLLIGLAPSWSMRDLELMDTIVANVTDPKRLLQVSFFDVSAPHGQADVGLYVPALKKFYQTPVVGFWRDGKLLEYGDGARARRIVHRVLG